MLNEVLQFRLNHGCIALVLFPTLQTSAVFLGDFVGLDTTQCVKPFKPIHWVWFLITTKGFC